MCLCHLYCFCVVLKSDLVRGGPDRFGPERAGRPVLDGMTVKGEAPERGRGTHPVKEAGHAREVEHPVKAAGRPVEVTGHAWEEERPVKAAGRSVKVTGHAQEVEHPVKSMGVNKGLVEMF